MSPLVVVMYECYPRGSMDRSGFRVKVSFFPGLKNRRKLVGVPTELCGLSGTRRIIVRRSVGNTKSWTKTITISCLGLQTITALVDWLHHRRMVTVIKK